MTSHIEKDLQARQAAAEQHQFDEDSARGWKNIILKHPNVCDHEANLSVAKEYSFPLPVSVQTFELLLSNPTFVAQLQFRDVDDQKATIVQEILSLLPEHMRGREPLKYKNLEQLRARLAELQAKTEMVKMSTEELRQLVKPAPQLSPRVPQEITPAAIKAADPDQIRSWNRRYGADSVNNRLFGRD